MESSEVPPSSRFKIGLHKISPGLLKLLEAAVGATSIALFLKYAHHGNPFLAAESTLTLFLEVTVFACTITTFLLLVTYVTSHSAATLLQKTIFELLYHCSSSVFYAVESISFLCLFLSGISTSEVDEDDEAYFNEGYKAGLAITILGLFNAVLYFLSAYSNYHSSRLP